MTSHPLQLFKSRRFFATAASAGLALSLTGCVGLAATGLVTGALSLTDRRTTGAQADDQAVELKAVTRLNDALAGLPNVNLSVVSYNRVALITGYVPTASAKDRATRAIQGIENVRQVVNESRVAPPQGLATYGRDALITTRVKAALIEDKLINANTIKVVTETGVVYLMGLVTQFEAERSSAIAARIPGVVRVVRAFEVLADSRIKQIDDAIQSGQTPQDARGGAVVPSSRPGQNPSGS